MAIQKIVTDDALSAFASDVKAAIANVSSPLVYKGTLGTGGTISTLPAASASNNGFAYVVITAGTYQGVVCAVGDVIASNGTAWNIIPQANSAETLPITTGSAVNTKEYIDDKTTLVKSASGDLITITDGGDNIPMKSLESEIVAVESGSGTKSPTNPYTISGFAQGVITVTDNDQITNTYTFTFGQTVYGGHFDNKGNLVVTHDIVDMGTLNWVYSSQNGWFQTSKPTGAKTPYTDLLCSCYLNGTTNLTIFQTGSYLRVNDSNYTDADVFKTAVNGQKIVYELATPITLSITSQDIPTLSGENNIFSNCGDTAIEYFTSSADEVVDLVRAEGTYFHKYSTSEHVVGVWIDNKTLYEKTVVIEGSNLTAGQSNSIAHGISNIDFIQITEGSFIFGNGTVKMPLPFSDEYKPITNSLVVIEGITDTAIKIGVGSNYINNASPVRAWITLQYTKTT